MKIKIAFVMSTLGTGGAERVISNILKFMDKDKFDASLVVLLKNNNDYLGDLPKDIKVLNLGHSRTRNAISDMIIALRKIEPDIIFSSLRGMSLILSLVKPLFKGNPIYVFREENTPSISIKDTSTPKLYDFYYRTLYRKADIIICQSDYMRKDLIEKYSFPEEKTVRIYNPVDFSFINSKSETERSPFKDSDNNNVIVVGRMAQQKGIDILLESIKKHKSSLEQNRIKVYFIGDGEKLDDYKELANEMKVSSLTEFVGRQTNPYQWMRYADLMILPSRYEGLPNALLEAAASGCEVVATLHPGGTREIMAIIDREEYLVDKLDWNENWFKKRKKPINVEMLNDKFEAKKIVKEYEKVFMTLYESAK